MTLKREVILPDTGRVDRRRRMQTLAVKKGREMVKSLRYCHDHHGIMLLNPLDIVEVIEGLLHAMGPVS